MFFWELKKICGKFTLYFTALMLFLTCMITLITNLKTLTPAYKNIYQAQEQLLWEYKNDREAYNAALSEYENQMEKYEEWCFQLAYGDIYPGEFIWENQLIDVDNYGDRELFADVQTIINKSENYNNNIKQILKDAYQKLNDSGIQRGQFLYEYQVNTILRYEKLQNLQLDVSITRGWDEYFSSLVPTIFLIITIIGVSMQTFLMEKHARIITIIHTTKKGKFRIKIAKITALLCVTVFQCLLFSLIPLLVYRFTTGLSNPRQLMQTVDGFLYCPYELSILECLILIIIGRVIISFTLSVIVSTLGQVSGSEIISFAIMLVYLIIQSLSQKISESSRFIFWKRYSLFEVMNFGVFFERYRAVNFLGIHVPSLYFILILTTIILLCGIILSICFKINNKEGIIEKFTQIYRRKERKKSSRVFTTSVLLFEIKKIFLNRKILCFVILAVTVRCIISHFNFQPSAAAEDKILRTYYADLAELGGIPGDESDRYIEEEIQYLEDCTTDYSKILQAYYNGEVSQNKLKEYKERYDYASTAWNVWLKLNERQLYLNRMSETYTNLYYINEEGLLSLLLPETDFIFLICLLVIFTPIFSNEYQLNFTVIQRTCRKGRHETLTAKLLCTVLFSAFLYIIFNIIDLGFFLSRFDLPNVKASIISLPEFDYINVNISIITYYALTKFIGLTGGVLLALLCCGISGVCRKNYYSILVSFVILIMPIILSFVGINYLNVFNLKRILCPVVFKDTGITLILYGVAVVIFIIKTKIDWEKS